jgi:hypothetical protein
VASNGRATAALRCYEHAKGPAVVGCASTADNHREGPYAIVNNSLTVIQVDAIS